MMFNSTKKKDHEREVKSRTLTGLHGQTVKYYWKYDILWKGGDPKRFKMCKSLIKVVSKYNNCIHFVTYGFPKTELFPLGDNL